MIHKTHRRKDDRLWLFTKQAFIIGYIEAPNSDGTMNRIKEIYKQLPVIEGETMPEVRERFLDLLDASNIQYIYYQVEGLVL